jgi:hypothetical protein
VLILGATEWETLPLSAGYVNSGRRYGITDLATTPHGEEPRAGGRWPSTHWKSWKAYSIRQIGRVMPITSTAERPSPVELTIQADNERMAL